MNTTRRVVLFLCIFVIPTAYLAAQSIEPKPVPNKSVEAPTSIDETFELDIVERRITEENFAASTAVGTDAGNRLRLQIGVGLTAGRIDVLLRNVRGQVRFRGSVDRILEIIRGHQPINN